MKKRFIAFLFALISYGCSKEEIATPLIQEEIVIPSIKVSTSYNSDGLTKVYYHSRNKTINTQTTGSHVIYDDLQKGDTVVVFIGDLQKPTKGLRFTIEDGISQKLNCTAKDSLYVTGAKIIGKD